jgi:hypothetical protein
MEVADSLIIYSSGDDADIYENKTFNQVNKKRNFKKQSQSITNLVCYSNSYQYEDQYQDQYEDQYEDQYDEYDSSDSDMSEINEEYLDAYEYKIDEKTGTYLFNGILLETKETILNNIKLYKNLNPDLLLEPVASSTLTAKGLLNNVDFQHESIISKMTMPTDPKIIKIGCNEEEIYPFPNNYVDYNITHIIDIIKNSKNSKFKTRIQCNCQNLLKHSDQILEQYDVIKKHVDILKNTNIIRKIEKYMLTIKSRDKSMSDKILKSLKRIIGMIFHQYLYDETVLKEIKIFLEKASHHRDFDKDENIHIMIKMYTNVVELVGFFKNYISSCKCIVQPYNPFEKIPIKPVAEDIKKTSVKKKSSAKKYIRRKTQGCGKYFSSQITFEIYGEMAKKIYKIKIFRNGNFQAPGIKKHDMIDIMEPLSTLTNYLSQQFDNNIYVSYIISVMRNYTSRIISTPYVSQIKDHNGKNKVINGHIYLDKLEEYCRQKKNSQHMDSKDAVIIYDFLQKKFNSKIANIIWDYSGIDTLKIAGISNNTERSGGLLLKFNRPIPEKPNKKMTVKILSIGKINFDGCNSELEVNELYYWLHNIFRLHKKDIIFDSSKFKYEISDDDEWSSVYED